MGRVGLTRPATVAGCYSTSPGLAQPGFGPARVICVYILNILFLLVNDLLVQWLSVTDSLGEVLSSTPKQDVLFVFLNYGIEYLYYKYNE